MKHKIRLSCMVRVLLAGWLISIGDKAAGDATWVPIGPEGGEVSGVVQHPTQPQVLFISAGKDKATIYKSTDRGNTWSKLAIMNGGVKCLSINRKNPTDLYAGTYGQFSKSTDGGFTWTTVYVSMTFFSDLSPDSLNPNIIHAAGYAYNYTFGRYLMAYLKSTDKGATWSTKTPANTEGYGYALCVDPKNPKVLFLGGYSYDGEMAAKLYKTTDGGDSWSDVTGPLTNSVYDLIMDSTSVKRVFALTGYCVYRSTDMGSSWQKNNGSVSGSSLCQDPKNKNSLYVGHNGMVFSSTDGGLNWALRIEGLSDAKFANCLLVDRTLPSTVFMGSDGGFFKSTNGGNQWTCFNTGIQSTHITAVHPVPSNPSVLYAAHLNGYVFRTQNALAKSGSASAVSWDKITTIPDCDSYSIKTILTDPSNPNLIYLYKAFG